jgi:hypothetical protein
VLRFALHPRLLTLLLLVCAACSTPISPYSQIDDEADNEPTFDAATPLPDAGSVTRDAGSVMRDAGSATRDAGPAPGVDLGSAACMRVPSQGVASLLVDDCATRAAVSCKASGQTQQQTVNQYLSDLARECKSPSGVTLGVVYSANGCPTQFRYDDVRVLGQVSTCLQFALEDQRIGCSLTCALVTTSAR